MNLIMNKLEKRFCFNTHVNAYLAWRYHWRVGSNTILFCHISSSFGDLIESYLVVRVEPMIVKMISQWVFWEI